MTLSQALKECDLIVENGPLGTRLKYDYDYEPNQDLTQDSNGRKILIDLYTGDIEVASQREIPIIINALTFRSSRNHLALIDVNDNELIKQINLNYLQIVIDLKTKLECKTPIIIGAPVGSMFDAYSTENTATVHEAYRYHQEQINIFRSMPTDFINAVTLSTVSEALGIALVCDESKLDFTIGFILGSNGKLLDGTSLDDAITEIDNATKNKPLGYLVTCTHPSVINLLDENSKNIYRLIGIQANGSSLPPSELAKLKQPIADDPGEFSIELFELKNKLDLKIIAGCCGTNKEHLAHIIRTCQPENSFEIF